MMKLIFDTFVHDFNTWIKTYSKVSTTTSQTELGDGLKMFTLLTLIGFL